MITCTLCFKVREANFLNKGDITKFGIPLVNCTVRELWERCKQQSNFTSRAEEIAEYNRYLPNRFDKYKKTRKKLIMNQNLRPHAGGIYV